ncbi:hypothetical protein T23_04500 [Turicibacter faecis]|uniref:Uncharacterized protein n=1 Tax=Turicibacter faecis TaxID=2963365 RepID=A0ABM8IL30_9FIRM|nr:hypothetical protein T23_04500 [Turicibacter sp. TC023]
MPSFKFSFLDRRIEKTEAASVELMIAPINKLSKPFIFKKKKQKKPVSRAVNNTPSVDKIRAGFTTGRAAFQLVPKPP